MTAAQRIARELEQIMSNRIDAERVAYLCDVYLANAADALDEARNCIGRFRSMLWGRANAFYSAAVMLAGERGRRWPMFHEWEHALSQARFGLSCGWLW